MWRKQIRAERAAETASKMVAKANALQKAAMERPGSSGNEGGPSEDVSENEADSRTLAQSSELEHALSTENVPSPASDSQTENTLQDSTSDEDNSERSSIPDEAQVGNTLRGSNFDERGRSASPDAEDSPLLGGV
jgi:hypothetical protein